MSHLVEKTKVYRFLEILPGVLTWATLFGAVLLSFLAPIWIAVYIILFDFYWVLKAINHALHLLSSFRKLKLHSAYDWNLRLEKLKNIQNYKQSLREEIIASWDSRRREDLTDELKRLDNIDFQQRNLNWQELIHLVILPTYQESLEVLEHSISSIARSEFPNKQIFFVLATEERDLERATANGRALKERYGDTFLRFEVIMHPDNVPGELKAKGANATHAARLATAMLKELGIKIGNVVVSAFDSDTVVSKNYFSYLTYAFLTAEKPYRTSYQPMPVYNNNIWDAPAIARVVAVANSFWQMVEASRPDRLVTFSSHAMSLKALIEVDYWPVHVVSDDSRIFWECWIRYNGDYRTQPLFTNVSLYTMLDETYWKTLQGQYKQKRRWAYGIENFPYLVTEALSNKQIPWWKKFLYIERMVEGFYFWATASLMIAILGWLPLLLGGGGFGDQVLGANLPLLTRSIMQVATVFLIFSVYINMVLLPPKPPKYGKMRTFAMIIQWFWAPIVSTIFGSFPAIDAQTRLMFGKYMGFWITPKARMSKIEDPASVFQKQYKEKL